MKINKVYRSLLDKSIASMLSAIEIYNKPNFAYREESFAILSVNAWELLLKAFILRQNKYKITSIQILVPAKTKKGTEHKKNKEPKKNRSGNPLSISVLEAIKRLEKDKTLTNNLTENINSIIEIRDNSIHFSNFQSITKQVQELGFACIKNYVSFIKKHNIEINLSEYNFYLMPLAYIDAKVNVNCILTSEINNYIEFVKSRIARRDETDPDFDITLSIDIDFKKGHSFDSIGVHFDKDGIPVTLSREQIRTNYPLTYKEVCKKAKERYSDFKQDRTFNAKIKEIKDNDKLHYLNKLDENNKKTPKQSFYSTNIWQELDKIYTKKS
jgi:hypothetical protein